MDNGVIVKTEEGSPQGGPLSPLLANIYLNEFDQEMSRRGVNIVRYADDIIVEAKSKRAAERLLKTSRKYLESKLKLKLNMEKSRVVSVYSQKFKFLGFTLGKNKTGVMIRVHKQFLKKSQSKIKRADSQKPRKKCTRSDEQSKSIRKRLVELSLHSKYKTQNAGMG